MPSNPRSPTRRSSTSTNASSKTFSSTSKVAEKPAFKVVYGFADGTYQAISMEELILQRLTHYARMLASENAILREGGHEKLREVAKILAKSENASLLGKLLKQKQVESFNDKNDDYTHFLDCQRGIANTKKLAVLLQERFGINSFRSCEDAVRAWKKNLRSAGGT